MERRTIPEGLEVFSDGSAVIIRRKWERGAGARVLFFTAFSSWQVILRRFPGSHGKDFETMALEFVIHVVPALGAAYFALCSMVNRTDVIISARRVKAVSTPLPWWGDRNLFVHEIRGVTVKRVKAGEEGAKFCLMFLDRKGAEKEFLRAGKGREHVEFIAKAVADILGVEEYSSPDGDSRLKPWMERINRWTVSRRGAKSKSLASGASQRPSY